MFTHLKFCLTTATHNFQVSENYSYLVNLRRNIFQIFMFKQTFFYQ